MITSRKSLSSSMVRSLVSSALAVTVGACLAACSTAPTQAASASAPPAASASAPAPSASAPAASVTRPSTTAQLASLVLQPRDFGAGWKATAAAATDSQDDDAATARTASCVGGKNTAPDRVAHADSRQFTRGGLSLSSSADSYRSAADVAADTAILTSPKIEKCLAASFRALLGTQLPAGAHVAKLAVKVVRGSGGGPADVIATGSGQITISAGGRSFVMYLTVIDIAGPLREAEVQAQSFGTPIDSATLAPYIDAVAARVAG